MVVQVATVLGVGLVVVLVSVFLSVGFSDMPGCCCVRRRRRRTGEGQKGLTRCRKRGEVVPRGVEGGGEKRRAEVTQKGQQEEEEYR